MDQNTFNKLQREFKKFLDIQKHPQKITENIRSEGQSPTNVAIEKTSIFGKDDAPIGYRIITTDKTGKQTYRIVSPV